MPESPQWNHCEYLLVEYAPSAVRETRVAVGLFLFDSSGRLLRRGFTTDLRRVRCLDPQADLSLLASLPRHFEGIAATAASDRSSQSRGDLPAALRDRLNHMQAEHSGSIQISRLKAVLTTNPEEEFRRLFQEHVEPRRPVPDRRPPRHGSRRWIHARLSEALRRHSLWDRLSRDVPVHEFTAPGDGFHIDFSYRPNGVTNYLHAISLERDWNQAKLLSYTFWRIREKTKARMTAIIADPDANAAEEGSQDAASVSLATAAESCRRILAGARIEIQPLSRIDPYLEKVGRELHR